MDLMESAKRVVGNANEEIKRSNEELVGLVNALVEASHAQTMDRFEWVVYKIGVWKTNLNAILKYSENNNSVEEWRNMTESMLKSADDILEWVKYIKQGENARFDQTRTYILDNYVSAGIELTKLSLKQVKAVLERDDEDTRQEV